VTLGQGVEVRPAAGAALRRQRSLTALLVGTGLIRVGAAGVTVAVQYDLTDLFHHRPLGIVVGTVGAAQAITEMLLAPVMARYADRIGRKLFIVGGPLIGAIAVLLVAFSTAPAQLFAARLLEGIGAAAFVPTALGAIAAATSDNTRARANASGAFDAATLAGYAGGFALGPFSYQLFHQWGFLLLAAAYLLAGLVCLRFVPRVPPLPVTRLSVLVDWIAGPGPMRTFLPAWLGTFGLIGAYGSNLASLLGHHHAAVHGQNLVGHLSPGFGIASVLVGGILLLVVGIVLWTPWIPRLGPVTQMRRAVPGAWLFSATLLAANHLPTIALPFLLPFTALGIVWLAGFGPAAVAYLANSSESHGADRALLMSFYTATLAAGGAVGAFLGGVAVSFASLDGLVVFGTLLAVMTFVLLRPVLRYERTEAALAVRD
jgi:MFS family permease